MKFIRAAFLCALLCIGLAASEANAGRVQVRFMPSFTAIIRARGSQHDLFEGWAYGARLMLAGPKNVYFLGLSQLKAETNYTAIPDPIYKELDFQLGMRRLLGNYAFIEVAGNAISSKCDSKSGFGFGGSFGGGLQFLLGKRIVVGVTTQYSVVVGPISGEQRRYGRQSVDLGVNF